MNQGKEHEKFEIDSICYLAIFRIYRNAVLQYVRQQMKRQFGNDAETRLKLWLGPEKVRELERNPARREPRDFLDRLDISDFDSLFAKFHFEPIERADRESKRRYRDRRRAYRSKLVKLTRERNSTAHPVEAELRPREALAILAQAREILLSIGQEEAAREIYRNAHRIEARRASMSLGIGGPGFRRVMTVGSRQVFFLDNENHQEFETLVVYLHGLGLDCHDFADVMGSRYRSVAPSYVGFDPGDDIRSSLKLEEHEDMLALFIGSLAESIPGLEQVLLVGFSIGADLAFGVLEGAEWCDGIRVGLLCLDCNLGRETCFISSRLAEMDLSDPMACVNEIFRGEKVKGEEEDTGDALPLDESLPDWLPIADYLVRVFKKLETDLTPLKRFAKEIVSRYGGFNIAEFERRHRSVRENVLVRYLFSDHEEHRRFCSALTKVDAAISASIVYGAGHFDLIERPYDLERFVEAFVESGLATSRLNDGYVVSPGEST